MHCAHLLPFFALTTQSRQGGHQAGAADLEGPLPLLPHPRMHSFLSSFSGLWLALIILHAPFGRQGTSLANRFCCEPMPVRCKCETSCSTHVPPHARMLADCTPFLEYSQARKYRRESRYPVHRAVEEQDSMTALYMITNSQVCCAQAYGLSSFFSSARFPLVVVASLSCHL